MESVTKKIKKMAIPRCRTLRSTWVREATGGVREGAEERFVEEFLGVVWFEAAWMTSR